MDLCRKGVGISCSTSNSTQTATKGKDPVNIICIQFALVVQFRTIVFAVFNVFKFEQIS